MKILLADDDKTFGDLLKKELEEFCSVDLVTNGVDAVLNFISNGYNVVLLDMRMPRLNGIDALRIIKCVNPAATIITFSGEGNEGQESESVMSGAVRFFKKPFEVEVLKNVIKSLL